MSPNKGIETMIEAMPEIVRRTPDVLYVVMGATHPALLAREGERYRDTLTARVRELGLDDHVAFIKRFVARPELPYHIPLCAVYATPYHAAAPITSGKAGRTLGGVRW